MSEPTDVSIIFPPVRYPQPRVQLPPGVEASDLIQLISESYDLISNTSGIAFYLDFAARPLGISLTDQTTEGVLGDLPDRVDDGVIKCEHMLAPLRVELIAPETSLTLGSFHAPSAFDAAVLYARLVRFQLNEIVWLAHPHRSNWQPLELIPGAALRGHWDAIVDFFRNNRKYHLTNLPDPAAITNRLQVELIRAVNRRADRPRPEPPHRALAPASPFEPLRLQAKALHLKGKELEAVLAICDGNGSAPLTQLGLRFEWAPPQPHWNAMRGRLNKKFKKAGWRFSTFNGEARVQQRKPGERK